MGVFKVEALCALIITNLICVRWFSKTRCSAYMGFLKVDTATVLYFRRFYGLVKITKNRSSISTFVDITWKVIYLLPKKKNENSFGLTLKGL